MTFDHERPDIFTYVARSFEVSRALDGLRLVLVLVLVVGFKSDRFLAIARRWGQ